MDIEDYLRRDVYIFIFLHQNYFAYIGMFLNTLNITQVNFS